MGDAVKKTISLAPELAREAEEIARAEGKSLSAVIQDALRATRATRLKASFVPSRTIGAARPRKKGCSPRRTLNDI